MEKHKINTDSLINDDKPFFKLFLLVIVLITIVLIIARLVFSFIPSELLSNELVSSFIDGKDRDFKILLYWMQNGLFEMYLPPNGTENFIGHFYLYHWYFIFYPFYLMPMLLSSMIWDLLRLISTIYISYRFYEITRDKKESILFLLFCGIGYAVDMHYNNSNWLILFLIVLSYLQLEKERMWISGILFTIATFKIYVIIFPIILLITKKIKFKDLYYYFLPFLILIIPYIVNPNYFLQMYSNWTYSFEPDLNVVLRYANVIVKLFEPAQLMFISFLTLVLVLNLNRNIIKNDKTRMRIYIVAFIVEAFLFITYLIFLGLFSLS